MLLLTLIAAPLTGFATWAATRLVLDLLSKRHVLDRPNERSSHDRPVPRGGGIAVVALVVPSWLFLAAQAGTLATVGPVVAIAALLALLSFVDDLRSLSAGLRLAAHATAVCLAVLALLPDDALLFGGWLPWQIDRLIVALSWVWFINLYNFMDGIDGITGVETIAVAGGLAACVLVVATGDLGAAPLAAVLAGALAGFLVLNWHPARIFLGDVGSVPLGYLVGFLLVWQACVEGRWWLALILPLYYWGDATTTLALRIARGEKVWLAHRSHAYQVAVQGGLGHARVARFVALLDGWLVLLCLFVAAGTLDVWLAVLVALVSVGFALCYLRSSPAGGRR